MIDMDRKAEHHIPYFDEDLFSAKALRDPFPFYHAIRDMGPVVRLRRPDVYAIGRFADVQKALRSPDILVSGQGVAFNDLTNAPSPQPATISSDGERHRKLRSVLSKPLMPAALKEHRERLSALITARIEELIDQPEFDAVTGIAQHLPVQAISYLVGLPEEGRSRMLDWASAVFNTSGPLATDGEEEEPDILTDLALRDDALHYLLSVDAQHLRPGSWSGALFQAVHAGKLELGEARAALSGLVVPSLDTTILSKANLLYNLGLNRHYWDMLRANPKLIPSAVLEGVRYSAVVRWFSRVAVRDYEVGGFTIPAGSRVMILYGSANRDERQYGNADCFDLTRNPVDQLGWGTGPHMCAGMHLARLEMEVMLEAMIGTVARIEVGTPELITNRGLYGLRNLPMKLFSR